MCPIVGLLISRCERSARFHQDVRKAGSIFWPVPAYKRLMDDMGLGFSLREGGSTTTNAQPTSAGRLPRLSVRPARRNSNGLFASAESAGGRQRFSDSCVPIGGNGRVERVSLPANRDAGSGDDRTRTCLRQFHPVLRRCYVVDSKCIRCASRQAVLARRGLSRDANSLAFPLTNTVFRKSRIPRSGDPASAQGGVSV